MIYKIMNINSLDDELIRKYFPVLTEARQKKIVAMKSAEERSVAFCAEILARQCLSEFCDAPEFSFSLLCNPNSKSVVGNFDVEICIVKSGEYVACAVSDNYIGIGIASIEPFTFRNAQNLLSDAEIRNVFSDSVHSFAENVNSVECNEVSVMQRYAVFSSLKEAHYYSSGRGIRSEMNKTFFDIKENTIVCSDTSCNIIKSYINTDFNLAVSIAERSKK